MNITVDLPHHLEQHLLKGWRDDLPRHLKEALAAEGYRCGHLSIGQTAELLGIGVIEAEMFLSTRGLMLAYDADDLRRDTTMIDRLLN